LSRGDRRFDFPAVSQGGGGLAIQQRSCLELEAGGEGQGYAVVVASYRLGEFALHDEIILAEDVVLEMGDLLVAVALEQDEGWAVVGAGVGGCLVEASVVPVGDEGIHAETAEGRAAIVGVDRRPVL